MTDPIPGLDRRQFLRAATASSALVASGTAAASHDGTEDDPLAGLGGTACDVDRTDDRYLPWSTDGAYGGWGGHEYHATQPGLAGGENPVVFVHGNTHDACDWSDHARATSSGATAATSCGRSRSPRRVPRTTRWSDSWRTSSGTSCRTRAPTASTW